MSFLIASVGLLGRNLRSDIVTVQKLLRARGFKAGAANGVCDVRTIAAIRAFQATFLPHSDGIIAPASSSWTTLAATSTKKAPTSLAQWNGDSSQWSQEKKLQSLKTTLRPKIDALLAALRRRDFQPKIVFAWRSVAVQQTLYEQGKSTVRFSFHNAQLANGTPNAYAADIIDSRYAWTPKATTSGFWDALGEEAKALGLYWGGDWVQFRDWAHVQLVDNSQLLAVRKQSGL